MGRAPCCDKANVKKGPWSPEEDAKLKDYIEQHGTGGNWIALPHKIGLKRCGKSCRLRWLNYLRPNIKHGGFSEGEDQIISSLYVSIGSRWSIIAAQLPGRTDNDIKNYWNTRLKKKLLGRPRTSGARRLSGLSRDPQGIDDSTSSHTLSTSALERLQLHMQLQSLHSPLSFYASPDLWPKYHPLGERILGGCQYNNINDIPTGRCTDNLIRPSQKLKSNDFTPISIEHHRANSTSSNGDKEEGNSGNGLSSLPSSIAVNGGFDTINSAMASKENNLEESTASFHMGDALETELDSLFYAKTSRLMEQENQLSEFDCFKELAGLKESIILWDNDFDAKSSTNSWNSASNPHQEGMFQHYLLGYDL